jgi:hypothetical protein
VALVAEGEDSEVLAGVRQVAVAQAEAGESVTSH